MAKEDLSKKFKRIDRRQRVGQFVRLKLNTYVVTALILFNVLILAPLAFFTWLLPVIGAEYELTLLHGLSWPVFIALWYLPFLTWNYSTITFPIKKGHKVLLDWAKTKKGRYISLSLNLTSFALMGWAANVKFAKERYVEQLLMFSINKEEYPLILVDDMDALVLLIYVAPVIFTALLIFVAVRHALMNKETFEEQFYKWEAPFITRFSHSLEVDKCDVITGYDFRTKKAIVIKEDQRYLHEGSFGATGSGKTSTSILLRIAQDLIQIATGRRKMGLVFLEPKGDGIDDVVTLAKKLGIPDEKIMVIDPTKAYSAKYNPFSGPMETAAASFTGTLDALTGDQDEFFKGQQNEAASTYTLLAKICFGDKTNILHIQQMFTDPRYLADRVERARVLISEKLEEPDLSPPAKAALLSYMGVVEYFEDEVLDYKVYRVQSDLFPLLYDHTHRHKGKQVVENKKDKYVTGAKKYLNDIAMNSMLSSLFKSEDGDQVFDADEFLQNGGILLVNTALAELEELSLMFGQFFIRQFQSAVFRRPKEGRIPIFFYVDEFPLYVNESFERLLTLGRSYKVGTLIAMQSLGQLDKVVNGFKETILSNASSKTVFGRGTVNDNKYFSEEFGEKRVIEESLNESASPMTSDKQAWGYRHNSAKQLVPRFTPTDIRELPFKHMVMQVVEDDNSLGTAKKVVGKFVHEARFIKPYFKIKKDELKSSVEKEFELTDYLNKPVNVSIGIENAEDDLFALEVSIETGESEGGELSDETISSENADSTPTNTEVKESQENPHPSDRPKEETRKKNKPNQESNVKTKKSVKEKGKVEETNSTSSTTKKVAKRGIPKKAEPHKGEQTSLGFLPTDEPDSDKAAAPAEPTPVHSEMKDFGPVEALIKEVNVHEDVFTPEGKKGDAMNSFSNVSEIEQSPSKSDTLTSGAPRTDYEQKVDNF